MKRILWSGLLCSCLSLVGQAQAPSPAGQTATPPAPKPTVEMPPPPPPKPAKSAERDTGGDVVSIEPFYWLNHAQPSLHKGKGSFYTLPGNLDFPGRSKYTLGGVLTIPTRNENSLQFSYFRTQGAGDTKLAQDANFFGNPFNQADFLATKYTLENMKLSWNYLTYPFPSNGAKFRLKTLWEVQYVTIRSTLDAPLDVNTTLTDGAKKLILPAFGLGIEYHPARHVRFEAKASGFGLPHRSAIWDAEGSAVVRAGRIELLVGGKAFHYKTSPKANQFFTQTLWGPYVGVRLIWK